jgi:hypothetical protein
MNNNKVVVIKGETSFWPWRVDKKKPQDDQPVTRKVQAVTLVTRKKKAEPETQRKLKPITQLVRNNNGQVSKAKVERLIHDLEKMIE